MGKNWKREEKRLEVIAGLEFLRDYCKRNGDSEGVADLERAIKRHSARGEAK